MVTIPVMAVAYQGLDNAEIAHSSVLTRTAQQIGGSFGTAVLAVVLERAITSQGGNLIAAFNVAFWWSVGFSSVAALLSLWLPGNPHTTAGSRLDLKPHSRRDPRSMIAGQAQGNQRSESTSEILS